MENFVKNQILPPANRPNPSRGRTGFVIAIFSLLIGLIIVSLTGCALVKLPNVPLKIAETDVEPTVLGPLRGTPAITTPEAWWQDRRPLLIRLFAENIYGRQPRFGAARIVEHHVTMQTAFHGLGSVEEILVSFGEGADAPRFHLALVLPNKVSGKVPLIIMQNFCGNRAALHGLPTPPAPHSPVPSLCTNPWARPLTELIFGRDINAPPFELILRRGYGVALFHAGDVIADTPAQAIAQLIRFDPGGDAKQRSSAIGAWAELYSKALDILAQDPRIDPSRIILWGHSRNGKAALLAAGLDTRIAGVIALQPGTAGSSLEQNRLGETIAQVTTTYPHWFSPAYADFAGRESELPVDQHQLLALIAPRPVMLGIARRDSWSDPQGTFLAARAASPAYRLLGASGLLQARMQDFDYRGTLSVWLRGGLHGVHRSDWIESLAFLDHWFGPSGTNNSSLSALGGKREIE